MIETFLSPLLLRCAHCQTPLSECPEFELEDWIVRCLECSGKNVIEIVFANPPYGEVEVVGWR